MTDSSNSIWHQKEGSVILFLSMRHYTLISTVKKKKKKTLPVRSGSPINPQRYITPRLAFDNARGLVPPDPCGKYGPYGILCAFSPCCVQPGVRALSRA